MLKRKEAAQLSVANIVVYQLFLCVLCLCRGKRIGNMQVDVLFFFMAELANFYFIFLTNTTKSTSSCFILLFIFFFTFIGFWFICYQVTFFVEKIVKSNMIARTRENGRSRSNATKIVLRKRKTESGW